jgi:hypothetical protein
MSSRRLLILTVLVIALGVAALWVWRARRTALEPDSIDLIATFPDAEKRTTMTSLEDAFAVQTVTINSERKPAIFAHPFARITWSVDVPERATLRTAAGLREDSWNTPADGALFRIGISEGEIYTELYRQMIQPQLKASDRRWFPIEIDLSAYAGRRVKVIFNTEPGDVGNAVADACVWGAPRIVPAG